MMRSNTVLYSSGLHTWSFFRSALQSSRSMCTCGPRYDTNECDGNGT